jgi:hypothetical protein
MSRVPKMPHTIILVVLLDCLVDPGLETKQSPHAGYLLGAVLERRQEAEGLSHAPGRLRVNMFFPVPSKQLARSRDISSNRLLGQHVFSRRECFLNESRLQRDR